MERFLIVGCGNIGSRHLQALAKLPFDIHVDIVEPSEKAKTIAKSRLDEISSPYTRNVSWNSSLKEIKKTSNLAIIATTAVPRMEIVNTLLNKGFKKFLLEKMVSQSSKQYDDILQKMKKLGASAWVNTIHKYFDYYIRLKSIMNEDEPFHVSITAGNWGIVGNAIHYANLFSWYSNDYKASLDGEHLAKTILPNKRGKDLIELAGTITGLSENQSTLSMTFLPYDKLPYLVSITTKNFHVIIDETNEIVYDVRNTPNELKSFHFTHISDTTTMIANDILTNGNCNLPTLEELQFIHDELLAIFSKHIEKLTNKKYSLCPIT